MDKDFPKPDKWHLLIPEHYIFEHTIYVIFVINMYYADTNYFSPFSAACENE